jgi:glycosyltransferase involved in cell wall biosynthesis
MLHGSSDLYGASKIFLFTAQALILQGHYVVVCLSEDGPLVQELQKIGAQVRIIRLGIVRRKYMNLVGMLNRLGVLWRANTRLAMLVRNESISLVYSNTAAVWIGAWISNRRKLPHYWHLHEIIEHPQWFSRFLKKFVYAYSDKILVVSKAVKAHWQVDLPDDKFELIYNGIDYEPYLHTGKSLRRELAISEETCVIGMIARVSPWKGQQYFLEIAKELNKKFINLIFIMTGDPFPGSEYVYKEIVDKINKNKLNDFVIDLGFRKDIPNVLATLDILVLPSILPDPFPTVILEGMASGKPVVATAHGGAPEMLVDQLSGYLVPWDNAQEAARKISPLIENVNLRSEMGVFNKNRVLKNFSLTSFQKNIARVFQNGV